MPNQSQPSNKRNPRRSRSVAEDTTDQVEQQRIFSQPQVPSSHHNLPCVVNVRKEHLRRRGFESFEKWAAPPTRVYIGRNMSFYVPGALGSRYANPFSLKKFSRFESLAKYEEYVRTGPLWDTLLADLGSAEELGCWCHPEGCHGDVLVRLLAERRSEHARGDNTSL